MNAINTKHVVVIGGGSGIPVVLRALKSLRHINLYAIVSVADDGGSSGVLRKELNMIPPGAVRKPLLALSSQEEEWSSLFEFRFKKGSLEGHTIGNILLAGAVQETGSFSSGVAMIAKLLKTRGEVIPSTLEQVHLFAELENGSTIKGEHNIDVPKHNGDIPIKEVYLNPQAQANPQALKAIQKADLIIVGPGDLYSSIIPNLLVKGISETINISKAKRVYINNLATEHGETTGFNASDFFDVIHQYIARLDYFLVNTAFPSHDVVTRYRKAKSEIVNVDKSKLTSLPTRVIYAKMSSSGHTFRHDPEKLKSLIIDILQNNA